MSALTNEVFIANLKKMTETQTFHQINDQSRSLPETHSVEDAPTVLVRRSDHTISTGNLYGVRSDGKYLVRVEKDGQDGTRAVTREEVSDQVQERLAEELGGDVIAAVGGLAVAGPPVESVQSSKETPADSAATEVEALTRGLSQTDREALDRYARYDTDENNAQVAGDGELSMRAGQYAGQEYQQMSPAAQSIVNQYVALWRQQ